MKEVQLKRSYSNLSDKMVRNVHLPDKKFIVDYVETIGNGDIKVWLKSGAWIGKKQFGNYQVYWRGWKSLARIVK